MKKALVLAVVAALMSAPPAPRANRTTAGSVSGSRPNVVLILTDDQRFDALGHMPILRSQLVRKGLSFERYYVVNPLCCPSRATTLTGEYSHTTGVYFNSGSQGGWRAFRIHELLTIATTLHLGGYRTALIGKYLNGYDHAGHVPAGWDRWVAMLKVGYYGVPFSVDGHEVVTGSHRYSTDVLADYASDFIRSVPSRQPLFLYLTPFAPHLPAIPASRDEHALAKLKPFRPPSYNEADISDKPAYVRRHAEMSKSKRDHTDMIRRDQLRSLLAVDDLIGRVVDALKDQGRLENTLIMFASDNGFLWGEHRLPDGKNRPYEESVRVPLVARWDGHIAAGTVDDDHVVGNLDLAPTWADLAGVPLLGADGVSMAPLLTGAGAGAGTSWRKYLLIEHGENGVPAFCQIHSVRYSYVLYSTGEEELYDLQLDPYELQNRAGEAAYRSIRDEYRTQEERMCEPKPPGWNPEASLPILLGR
ncbi:MAG TPA: sulfatase [Actinomycetota bacterium]|nr:sulfatase [Actinomycetota bacterium]